MTTTTPRTERPNDDEVICPNCVHQFRAIPVNVQADLAAALEENAKLRKHAEAMHEEIEKLRSYLARLHGGETIRSSPADAYRADFPKEPSNG